MSEFKKAIEMVICVHEGGFQNRADDPGNWTPDHQLKGTRFGISAHSFPNEDIEGLTIDRACELYQQVWGHLAEINDQLVLTKVLDLAVNMQWGVDGPETKILQRAIVARGIPVAMDGKFGPRTVTACNNLPADALLDSLCEQATAYYQEIEAAKPEMSAWFKNWNARAKWKPVTT